MLLEQFGVSTCPSKYNCFFVVFGSYLVNQQQIAFYVAFTVLFELSAQTMVFLLRWKRGIVSNQKQHSFLQTVHVMFA